LVECRSTPTTGCPALFVTLKAEMVRR
jgi:hypothetical protein